MRKKATFGYVRRLYELVSCEELNEHSFELNDSDRIEDKIDKTRHIIAVSSDNEK